MEETHFQQNSRRWIVLAGGFLMNCGLFAVSAPLALNAPVAAAYLGVSVHAVHWLSYAWAIAAAASALPAAWLLERAGLKQGCMLSAAVVLMGSCIRLIALAAGGSEDGDSNSSGLAYACLLAGSIAAALGAVPLQASTALIAASWFSEESRGLADTLVRATRGMRQGLSASSRVFDRAHAGTGSAAHARIR
jgi:MFS family permease